MIEVGRLAARAAACLAVALGACGGDPAPAGGADGPGPGGDGPGSGGGGDGGTTEPIPPDRVITIDGRRVLVDGVPIELRGVCWSPVARGNTPPPDFTGYAAQDIALMRAAGINAVRTYSVIGDRDVLDQLAEAGIWVVMAVASHTDTAAQATGRIAPIADHPAILAWAIGNEWNYPGNPSAGELATRRDRLQEIAAALHAADPTRPVATVYGELPSAATIDAMPDVDLWGLNVYRGITFYDLFARWQERPAKPMFLAEYGADAWDARDGGSVNVAAQADATRELTLEILATSTARVANGLALGGMIFEWSDEWWKAGTPSAQNPGGDAPGELGPHPDRNFDEEWWGIVDIDRVPRPAYEALKQIYVP